MKKIIITTLLLLASANTASAVSNTVLDFDGTSDYVVVSDNAVLDQANRLSLSVWIEPDDTPAGDEYILYRYNNYYIKINSSRKIVGGLNDSTERVISTSTITCDGNTWTHIEMTYDKDAGGTNEIKLYINGVLDAVGDYSTAVSASDKKLYIGAGDLAGDNTPENWFDGQIDDVRLYQYARSASDVQLDYNEGLATHFGPVLKDCDTDPASCVDYGLVGYWNFDEGTGQTAYDATDNSNNGTLTNGPVWTRGKKNGALSFDGVDDYVDIPLSATLSSQEMTGVAWIKVDTVPTEKKGILTAGGYNFHMWLNPAGTINFGAWTTLTNEEYTSSKSFSFGVWRHIVVVNRGATDTKLYVDGNLIDTFPLSGNLRDISFFNIGRHPGVSLNYFNDLIDDVRIYNKALTPDQTVVMKRIG